MGYTVVDYIAKVVQTISYIRYVATKLSSYYVVIFMLYSAVAKLRLQKNQYLRNNKNQGLDACPNC